MNKKCIGCGATMQCVDCEKEGYVEEKNFASADICKRCFRIKFYGDYKVVNTNNTDFINILKKIAKTGDLVLYMVDLFNIDKDIEEIYRYLNNPIILVVTKRDILPKDVTDKKILEYFNRQGFNIKDSVVISSKKNYNFDRLYQLIRMYKTTNNVYVVGNTNVGKSTFVNRCITNFGDRNANVTTSILPSTTLDLLSIDISDYLTLIDTPGILSNNSYINIATAKELKKMVPRKMIKPVIYQLKASAGLLIDAFARLDIELNTTQKENNVVLYMSPDIKVKRVNVITNNTMHDLKCHEFNVTAKEDIVINGLGWIKIMEPCIIKVYLPDNIDVYRRNCII